jgi:hypothetical protein
MSSAAAPSTAAKDSGPPDEYISIAQIRYTAAHGKPAEAAKAKEQLLALIKKREMGPLYSAVCEQLGTLPDAALAASFAAR